MPDALPLNTALLVGESKADIIRRGDVGSCGVGSRDGAFSKEELHIVEPDGPIEAVGYPSTVFT